MKKGFTLVELLGVISVLGITALLVVPSVEKIIRESKQRALENNKKTILSATKNWVSDNKTNIDGDEYIITVEDLKSSGYLEYNLKNPVSDKCIGNDTEILIKKDQNNFKYMFNGGVLDGADSECEMVLTKANLYLMGKNPISIKQGDRFVDPGYTATNVEGDDISTKVLVEGTVDTDTIGTYELVYTVVSDGFTTKRKRTVNVMDVEEPYISHPGTTVLLNTVSSYNIMDEVRAVDNSGEVIPIKATTNLTLGINGEYEVVYYATDKSGNEYTDTRRIVVRSDNNTIYNTIKDSTETISEETILTKMLEEDPDLIYSFDSNEFLKDYYKNKKIYPNYTSNNWVRIKNNLYRITEFSNNFVSLLYQKSCNSGTCQGNGLITDKKMGFYGTAESPELDWNSSKNEVKKIQNKWLKEQKIDKYIISNKYLLTNPLMATEFAIYEDYYKYIYCQLNEDECDSSYFLSKGLDNISPKNMIESKINPLTINVAYDYSFSSYLLGTTSNNLFIPLNDPNYYVIIGDFSGMLNMLKLYGEEYGESYQPISFALNEDNVFSLILTILDEESISDFMQFGNFAFNTIIHVKPDLTVSTGTGTESDPYVLVP